MKSMNIVKKFGRKLAAGGAVMLAGTQMALADTAAATTAMEATKGNIEIVGWAAFGLVIAAAAFKYMRRAV